MKFVFTISLLLTMLSFGCSPADNQQEKPQKSKQEVAEETARSMLNNRTIIKEQGELTEEELNNAKDIIDSPTSKNRRKRAIGKEQGGPPAPEGLDRKEAEAKRHINTK